MIGIALALIPLVSMFSGILILKWPVHKAGLLSTGLTILISFLYSGTSVTLLVYGWLYGILIIHRYILAYFGSFFLTFYLMTNGCFEVIGKNLKRLPGGIVYKVFLLSFGVAILMLSAGAGIDWIAMVYAQMGMGTWAIPVLIDGACDAFSQFAYLSTPITVPTTVYGETFGFTEADIAALLGRFLYFVIPVFILGVLAVLRRDGKKVTWIHVGSGMVYGELLAIAANFLLRTVNIMGVGVLLGVFGITVLMLGNWLGTRFGYLEKSPEAQQSMTREEKREFLTAISPIIIVSTIASTVSLPWISSVLKKYVINIPLIADQVIPFEIFQPYVWSLLSILLSFLVIKPRKETIDQTMGLLFKRLIPFVIATWICSGMVFTYNWSGMVINAENQLILPPDRIEYNLIQILATAASKAGPTFYIALVPFLAVFGCMLFGHELTSTLFFVRFHFIAASALNITKPLVLVVGHMVANLGIVDVRKMMRSLSIIGAYGEEWKTMRFTFVLGLIITLIMIPLIFFAFT